MNLNDVRESAAAEQHFLFVTRWLAAAYMLAGSESNDGRAREQPGFLWIYGVVEHPPPPPPSPVTPADRPCEGNDRGEIFNVLEYNGQT